MKRATLNLLVSVFVAAIAAVGLASAAVDIGFDWQVVVNNAMKVPGDTRNFNSYNQPSVNMNSLVVFRARSKGGAAGEPAHGVFARNMGLGTPVSTIFGRTTVVPYPNNLGTLFVEPPSFPRIDMWSDTVASRGNHPPIRAYSLPGASETRGGTTGIYTNPLAILMTGASNLGAAPGFAFFAVPDSSPAIKFDVFPGAPAVTDTTTLVFKGNYSVPDPNVPGATIGKTGVYYRDLMIAPAGGTLPVVTIADSDTTLPGTTKKFGSLAPPSAVARLAVFTAWDNELAPTAGGIYLAQLTQPAPPLTTLVRIGDRVPGERPQTVFTNIGEGVSFDGRFVGFWATWGGETKTLVLQCPDEGNKDRLAFCASTYPAGFQTTVPVHQGIFVYDTKTGVTLAIAKAPDDFSDFVYWNYSGMVPGMSGHGDDVGEPARWRSASFVAVSGLVDGRLTDATVHAAFKARTGEIVGGVYQRPRDGIYLRQAPGAPSMTTVVETGMDGTLIDPAAIDVLTQTPLPVTDVGLERDGFRGQWLSVSLGMGTEDAGWAGIYLTAVVPRASR